MSDDVTPSEVRSRGFDAVRRGYDRAAVDTYLGSLADEIERLVKKIERRKTRELKIGLDDPEALALELETIGGEVASILEAARTAADGMRSRASADVDEWRTAAETDTKAERTDATEQSQSMRAAAWNEGSSMLSAALAEARMLTEQAGDDALFIRAEAEREAIRLTGDARRDREESIRAARMEAEQLIDGARNESDGILAAAGQKAEQAQERARALEDRRTELLAELESTRASIGTLEQEIESRRVELETPEPLIEPDYEATSHHSTDSGSVRIISGTRVTSLKPVDAEDLVADVVAIRSGAVVAAAKDAEQVEIETVTVIAPPETPDQPPETNQAAPAEQDEPIAAATDQAASEATEDGDPGASSAAEAGDEPADGPTDSGTSKPEGASTDDIGSLFASLRSTPESEATESKSPEAGEPAEPNDEVAPEPVAVPAAAEPPPPAETDAPPADATLIPLQNDALRDIKRTLVGLQNDALENLRNDEKWSPKKLFTNQFREPFEGLALGLTGSKSDGGAAKGFASDLHTAVEDAIASSRSAGAGGREIASSVSRVFRTWRADEAERRVTDAAENLASSHV